MSNTKVTVEFNLADKGNSIEKSNNNAKALNKTLEKTKQLAGSTSSGAQAVKASLGPSIPGENQAYGQARGAMGATGASGRDFANQAQGLGGLVRLYATYAANLFAATAAFNALSSAVETSNMTKGLVQLGAEGGRSLTGLSKQFAEVTGYAVSTREAIEATAKAASSGLSEDQFLKLGSVALRASQALGVNMSDAVSRLTRGITKLEPELLDELGIFTKVGVASDAYAKSIGKSANSLTDFEKRQAFANAALEEGQKKFGDINLDTNPYDKFLATLKNTGFEILNVINVAVKPLVDLLSSSPTGMLAAIGLIGTRIVKQALPAITEYRDRLNEATQQTAQLAAAKAKDAAAAFEKYKEASKRTALGGIDVKASEAEDVLEGLEAQAKANRYVNKEVKALIETKKTSLEYTNQELSYLDRLGKRNTQVSKTYRELADGIRVAQRENLSYMAASKRFSEEQLLPPGRFTRAAELQRESQAASNAARASRITQFVNKAYDTEGFVGAAQRLINVQSRLDKLGTAGKWATNLQAGALIAARGVSTLASGLMSFVAGPLTAALILFPILESLLGKNGKAMAEFNSAVDMVTASVEASDATLKKYGGTFLDVSGLTAYNTSLSEMSGNLTKLTDSFVKAGRDASTFDNIVNAAKGKFGSSRKDVFADNLSKSISQQLKLIRDPKQYKEAERLLTKALGGGSAGDAESLKTYLGFKSEAEMQQFGVTAQGIFAGIAKEADKTTANLQNISGSFKSIETAYQALENSLVQKSVLGDFGQELINQASAITTSIRDTSSMFAYLNTVIQDNSKIKFFSASQQQEILRIADAAKNLQTDLQKARLAKDVTKTAQLENQVQTLKVNLEKAINASVVDGFKMLQLEASKIVRQATIDASKGILSLLPKNEDTLKAQLSLDLQLIDLRKQELVQARAILDATRLNTLATQKANLLKEKEFVGAFRTPEGRQQEEERISKSLKSLEIEETAIKSGAKAVRNLPGVTPEEANTAIAARARETGNLNAQLKGLDLQKFGATAISQASDATQAISNAQDYFKNIKDTREIEANRYKLTEEFGQLSKAQQLEKSEQFRQETAEIDAIISSLEKRKAVASALIALDSARALKNPELIAAAESGLATAEQQYLAAYNLNTEQESLNKTVASRAILIADEVARLSSASDIYKQYFADQTLGLQQQEDTLQLKQAQLAQDLERGKISQDEFNAAKYLYDTEQAGITRANALLSEQEKYTKTILDIRTKIAEAGVESPEQTRLLQQAKVDTDAATAAINRQYDQTLKLRDLNQELAQRQQGYADAFGRAFDGMTDAIINFAKTGKLSFSDMISSFIEDLIRLEIKQMQMSFIQSQGGPSGIAGSLFSAFLGGSKYTPGSSNFVGPMPEGFGAPLVLTAKGAAYDTGVQAFAKGGAFTNSVVSSPTLFKFAKGTGLMGEAGPEAIMPLKRDNNGNLGVRAQGGEAKVDVVVNNFGSEKAETRETVDSRGNRKIEVVIGEMVAGETARSGSPQQRVLGGTFGLRPQLIRR